MGTALDLKCISLIHIVTFTFTFTQMYHRGDDFLTDSAVPVSFFLVFLVLLPAAILFWFSITALTSISTCGRQLFLTKKAQTHPLCSRHAALATIC